ncbi:MAG: FeoB-associated Cys-rich membrane protein [Clostridia bacterium]|nr:FeoB-associated Cys-rich membrane protein [Clostridia bacterium]
MENIIAIAVIVLVLGGAIFYLVRAKKRGQKCVGCPYCKQCSGTCSGDKQTKK